MAILIGCAGWSLRRDLFPKFPTQGTHLERYSARFTCVEINSSFYRSHQLKTYQRWAASTPTNFRFAVKLPKEITHVRRLADALAPIEKFVSEIEGLGEKLGPILVQLPASLVFDIVTVQKFFRILREQVTTSIVCEPRNTSWFDQEADELMREFLISRVAADPKVVPAANVPGGDTQTCYIRLHGSPRMYYTSYTDKEIDELVGRISALAENTTAVWCIFDNTAEGAAIDNALSTTDRLRKLKAVSARYTPME